MSDPAIEAAERASRKYETGGQISLQAIDAAREALRPLRDLHRPAQAIFSWSAGVRFAERCEECKGKAGVHPCGCWADDDIQFRCSTCAGDRGGHVEWPCATARLIYPAEELERGSE